MKVPVLSSLILFHARQAGGGYHSFLPSGGGPRTHTGAKDPIHSLPRHDQVMIFRLRNGHNKLRHHMYSRLKVGDSSGCPCGEPRQDASHILQDCTLFKEARDRVWNSEFPLWRKLYGSRQDLEMTDCSLH